MYIWTCTVQRGCSRGRDISTWRGVLNISTASFQWLKSKLAIQLTIYTTMAAAAVAHVFSNHRVYVHCSSRKVHSVLWTLGLSDAMMPTSLLNDRTIPQRKYPTIGDECETHIWWIRNIFATQTPANVIHLLRFIVSLEQGFLGWKKRFRSPTQWIILVLITKVTTIDSSQHLQFLTSHHTKYFLFQTVIVTQVHIAAHML